MKNHELKEITLLDHKDLYKVKEHHHNYVEIVYYISGSGEIVIDNKKYSFSDNYISITLPGVNHTEYSFDKVKLIYIGFTIQNDELFSVLQNGCFKCPHDLHVLTLLKEIKYTQENNDFYQEDLIDGYLYTLIRMLSACAYKAHTQSRKMIEIKNYINQNIKTKINAQSVSEHFSYDYDYLRKLFKQYFQTSISDYILKKKLEVSLEMLKRTNKSIEEISDELYFSSPSHFIRLFKKNYNITPKQFLLNYDKNTSKKSSEK